MIESLEDAKRYLGTLHGSFIALAKYAEQEGLVKHSLFFTCLAMAMEHSEKCFDDCFMSVAETLRSYIDGSKPPTIH